MSISRDCGQSQATAYDLQLWSSCAAFVAVLMVGCGPPAPEDFLEAAQKGRVAVMRDYLSAGGNPNVRNRHGDTALHWAVYRGDTEATVILLNAGADISLPGTFAKAPLHLAAERGHAHLLDILMGHGADCEARDREGRTPFLSASIKNQLKVVQFLSDQGCHINASDRSGHNALHHAIKAGEAATVAKLVLLGVDPEQPNHAGVSPLDLAAETGKTALFAQPSIAAKFPNLEAALSSRLKQRVTNAQQRPQLKLDHFVAELHRLTNIERKNQGLSPLTYDPQLARIAADHSRDMAVRNFFEHQNPDGETPADRARRQDYSGPQNTQRLGFEIGENILSTALYSGSRMQKAPGEMLVERLWRDPDSLARSVIQGWMGSPGHRQNILKPQFEREGFGVHMEGDTIWVTQNFYGPIYAEKRVDECHPPRAFSVPLFKRYLRDEVNQRRRDHDLHPLSQNPLLAEIAVRHSRNMVELGFFGHVDPQGNNPSHRANALDFDSKKPLQDGAYRQGIGENLSKGLRVVALGEEMVDRTRYIRCRWLSPEEMAKEVVSGWMASEGHRQNILDPIYSYQGFGVAEDSEHRIFVTQNLY